MNKKQFKKKYGLPIEELYDLDSWLTAELGKRLLAWVHEGPQTYPDGMEYKEWKKQLKKAGKALVAYNKRWDEGVYSSGREEAAKDALRWVADHLTSLWD